MILKYQRLAIKSHYETAFVSMAGLLLGSHVLNYYTPFLWLEAICSGNLTRHLTLVQPRLL